MLTTLFCCYILLSCRSGSNGSFKPLFTFYIYFTYVLSYFTCIYLFISFLNGFSGYKDRPRSSTSDGFDSNKLQQQLYRKQPKCTFVFKIKQYSNRINSGKVPCVLYVYTCVYVCVFVCVYDYICMYIMILCLRKNPKLRLSNESCDHQPYHFKHVTAMGT